MKLPNAQRAVADIRKLRDYCLNPNSPKGRNKARVFASVLGLTQRDAPFLRRALLTAARERDCLPGESDEFGQRYTVDFELETVMGRHRIRSGWIVKHDEDFPRLTTCYVLLRK
ncbi:MAG: DUF6883 domain-containing protein [Verrucomicrobiia bacterium]